MAIAKDVVAQIKAGQFIIKRGHWLTVKDVDAPAASSGACQATLTGKTGQFEPAECHCCAIGAAAAASLRLFNIGEFDSSPDFEDLKKQLNKFFSNQQLALIEAAFECRCEVMEEFETRVSQKTIEKTYRFQDLADDERALAIFTNIIKNNGTFVP